MELRRCLEILELYGRKTLWIPQFHLRMDWYSKTELSVTSQCWISYLYFFFHRKICTKNINLNSWRRIKQEIRNWRALYFWNFHRSCKKRNRNSIIVFYARLICLLWLKRMNGFTVMDQAKFALHLLLVYIKLQGYLNHIM